jgi:hypothetical protein
MSDKLELEFARIFDANLPEFADKGQITCDYNEYAEVLQRLRARKCFIYTVQVVRGGYILQFDKPRLTQPGLL